MLTTMIMKSTPVAIVCGEERGLSHSGYCVVGCWRTQVFREDDSAAFSETVPRIACSHMQVAEASEWTGT